jgi:hypothetical protein
MQLKYNNRCFWYDWVSDRIIDDAEVERTPTKERPTWIYFASEHEWNVYQILRDYFKSHHIHKDYVITLVKGKQELDFIHIDYQVDFKVHVPAQSILFYVEAKGLMTNVSKMKLKLLCLNKPRISDKLHLVFKTSKRIKTSLPIYYHSMDGFKDWLFTEYTSATKW